VEVLEDGKSGKLVDVLRSTNIVADNIATFDGSGGAPYSGKERSDIHGAIVIDRSG